MPTRIDVPMTAVIPKMKLYTEAQMLAFRDAALEEAAALCAAKSHKEMETMKCQN